MASAPTYEELEQRVESLEKALAQSSDPKSEETTYGNLFKHMLHEIHIWELVRDAKGEIKTWKLVDANPAALKAWGRELSDVVGKTPDEIFPGSNATEQFMPIVTKIFTEKKPHIWESYFAETDQTLHMVSIPAGERFISTGLDISTQKRAEDQIARQQYYLEKSQEIGQLGTWQIDIKQNKVYWTDENCLMFGVPPGTVVDYELFLAKVHPDDRDYVNSQWQAAMDGEPYDIEHRVCVDGAIKWVREKADMEFDKQGKAISAIGITQDITGRKQAVDKLKVSEARFRSLMEQSPVATAIYCPDGMLKQANAAYAKHYGLSEEALTALYEKYNVRQDEQAKRLGILPFIEQVFSGEEAIFPLFEYDSASTLASLGVDSPIPRKRWAKTVGFPLKDDDGSVLSVVLMSEDITESKQAEETLRALETRNQALLDHSPVCHKIVDLDLNLQYMNANGFRMLNLEPTEELYGKPYPFDFFPEESRNRLKTELRKAIETEKVVSLEDRACDSKGNEVWLHHNLIPVHSDDGSLDYITVVSADITERNEMEAELVKSRREFSDIFKMALQMICIADIDGSTFLKVNPAFTTVLGYDESELVNHAFSEFVHPDDIEPTRRLVEDQLQRGQKVFGFTNRYRHKDGHWVWLEWTSHPVPEEGVAYGLAHDITDRKASEDALRASEKRFREIANSIPGVVYQFTIKKDGSYAFPYVGENSKEFLHHEASAIEADPNLVFNMVPPDELPPFVEAIEESAKTMSEWRHDFRVVLPNGVTRWFEGRSIPHLLPSGEPLWNGVVADITERKKAETLLKESEQELRHLVENSPDLIMIQEVDGTYRFVGPQSTKVLGIAPDEIFTINAFEHIHAEDVEKAQTAFQEAAAGNEIRNLTYRFIDPDGEIRWLDHTASPLIVDDTLSGIHSTVRNITERKKAEELQMKMSEKLREANEKITLTYESSLKNERLNALGLMASGISHDFNNVLMPILGISDLMLNDPGMLADREEALSSLETIRDAARDAQNIVRRLRQVYKPDYLDDYVAVDLARIVEASVSMTTAKWREEASAKGIDISIETDLCETNMIDGDAAELREALVNIIFNAVDAMDSNGTISFRTRLEGSHTLVLEISDTGKGMDKEQLSKCIDAFFTTKGPQGTGLGLSMVHGIVERHGGTMRIDSEPQKGTTIRLMFPASSKSEGQPVQDRTERTELPALSILVIDDEKRARNLIEVMLKRDDHQVRLCEEGAAGIKAFRDESFDLVITDRAMPGTGGDEVAKEIHRLSPDTPVIMLTGFGDIMNDHQECPTGVSKIVGKPVSLRELRSAIRSVISPEG